MQATRSILAAFAALLVLCLAPSGKAVAQTSSQTDAAGTDAAGTKPRTSEEDAQPERPSDAAYMAPLGRLAMILGSMHFLRKLCDDPQADVWRDKMQELIAAQSPSEADRKQLIASFNNGYRTFAATYRSCTSAATIAVNRYQKEGAALAREIGSRYGS